MPLVDTHAHIHFDDYIGRVDEVLDNAKAAGVDVIVCVGVDDADSAKALAMAAKYSQIYATVGLHPHEAKRGQPALDQIAQLARSSSIKVHDSKLVAIGECGLDFYRNLSDQSDQERALRFQIELALELNLPMVWHVREAFDRFFEIVDEYPGLRGIVHCFSSNRQNMQKAVERGFMVAFNGIMTFTKDQSQHEAAKKAPLQSIVLETDCPFLSPAPLRGQANQPANLKYTAEFLTNLRREPYDSFAMATTANARKILKLK